MNVYITTGTYDFLKKIKAKYSSELVMMTNASGALLYHETNGKTVFSAPRKYEAIQLIGEMPYKGFAVMNNISVTDESRPVFEYQMKNQSTQAANTAGFRALRILRPLSSSTYIILTIWNNETDFSKWKNSPSYFPANTNKIEQSKIFESAPYFSKFVITENEE
ncbi:antibiotic biosynthesis monooxygenase [Neobacillus mesonae]|uniref:antibiotic biosynthesis monooxygenase family protein n=1 Tax=Neobacillus mesonae TaxID=1193713 RepID=UPI00203F3EAA|nr:antibiotic biosynthesis monooxygenase [Neobacillus mesonae]MCM3567824.1 antibiotic biosynthesis monooxygenase [Neobacillus mesonae]